MTTAVTKRVEVDNKTISKQLTAQYRLAVSGLFEVVKFGAMLLMVETSLTRETRGCVIQDGSLKQWLEVNCPEINYKTAMRFKAVAARVRDEVRLGVRANLAELLSADPGDLNDALRRKRKIIEEMIAGTSQRQLLMDLDLDGEESSAPTAKGGKRAGAGRPLHDEKFFERQRENALDEWKTLQLALRNFFGVDKPFLHLDRNRRTAIAGQLETYLESVNDSLKG